MNEAKTAQKQDVWTQVYRMFGNNIEEGERFPVFLKDKEGNRYYVVWNPETAEVRTHPFNEEKGDGIDVFDPAGWEVIGIIPEEAKLKAACIVDLENAVLRFARTWALS